MEVYCVLKEPLAERKELTVEQGFKLLSILVAKVVVRDDLVQEVEEQTRVGLCAFEEHIPQVFDHLKFEQSFFLTVNQDV